MYKPLEIRALSTYLGFGIGAFKLACNIHGYVVLVLLAKNIIGGGQEAHAGNNEVGFF